MEAAAAGDVGADDAAVERVAEQADTPLDSCSGVDKAMSVRVGKIKSDLALTEDKDTLSVTTILQCTLFF